jgi:hypothetical protein
MMEKRAFRATNMLNQQSDKKTVSTASNSH